MRAAVTPSGEWPGPGYDILAGNQCVMGARRRT